MILGAFFIKAAYSIISYDFFLSTVIEACIYIQVWVILGGGCSSFLHSWLLQPRVLPRQRYVGILRQRFRFSVGNI